MVIWKRNYYGWWDAYNENGEKFVIPSVSKVLEMKEDPELENWIKEIGEEKAQQIMKLAADRGIVFHTFLENFYGTLKLKGDPKKALLYTQKKSLEKIKKQNISEKQIKTGRILFYQLLEEFTSRSEIYKIINLERKIVDFQLAYRGAFDINYFTKTNDGIKNVIADFKASSKCIEKNSVKERKYKLQLAAYWNAYEKLFNRKLDFAKIWVSTREENIQEIKIDRDEYEEIFKEFFELLKSFHEKQNQNFEIFKVYKIIN